MLTAGERASLYHQGCGIRYPFENIINPLETPAPTSTPTLTPGPTPTPRDWNDITSYGSGWDGDVTITGTVNINASNSIAGRSCADGGDAVAYSVLSLTSTSATVSKNVAAGCLEPGDEVMIINLHGNSTNYANVGNYEFLRVVLVVANQVYFETSKTRYYGSGSTDDTNIGTNSTKQRVMLMRVPNYNDLTVNGTLKGYNWNGLIYGVVAFRVNGTLSGTGAIHAYISGFDGGPGGDHGTNPETQNGTQGNSYVGSGAYGDRTSNAGGGGGGASSRANGGGASYGAAGDTGSGSPVAQAGATYGNAALTDLFLGSGGGGGAGVYNGVIDGKRGGKGAGAIYIAAHTIDFDGDIFANGEDGIISAEPGISSGGGGSGGSVRIEGYSISVNSLQAYGGIGSGFPEGGFGRIAVYYEDSYTAGSANPSPYTEQISDDATPTPTPTPTGTPAAQAGWEDANYSYAGDAPHAVTSVQRGEVADVYEYDEAGNMVCRIEDGQTWIQSYNSANRMNKVEKVPGDCDTPGTPESTWTFYYDGDGNRIKQANPDGSTTLFLMGGMYIVDVPASGPAEATKYYSIAGQRIAMEVGTSGVQYLLTDHLGSVSAVLNASGQLLEDKEQRYMPFGMPRVDSAELGTEYGYTGQKNYSAEFGLMDYNARFLVSKLGRWTQPDSIGPNPFVPQSMNRYSYVGNGPIAFIDPSGHYEVDYVKLLSYFGVTVEEGQFTKGELSKIYTAVRKVGVAFSKVLGGPENEAFKSVYGSMHFNKCESKDSQCQYGYQKNNEGQYIDDEDKVVDEANKVPYYITSGMLTYSSHVISVGSMSNNGLRAINNVIHELGHALNQKLGGIPAQTLDAFYNTTKGAGLRRVKNDRANQYGFFSTDIAWSVALSSSYGQSGEEFADSFLGWVWNKWELEDGQLSSRGQRRKDFMDTWMPFWLLWASGGD